MLKYLKAFFAFMLPIVRKAAVQIAADELTKAAYADGKGNAVRRRTSYSRYDRPDTWRRATDDIPRQRAVAFDVETKGFTHEGREFHDVLLVAFDISGPTHAEVCTWLRDNMPATGLGGDRDEIYLDAWWIADDKSIDDTDSAVFVKKGWQEKARRLLRLHNMAN